MVLVVVSIFFSGTEYASCCDRYWTTVYDIDGIASCFEYSDESININSGVLYGALCTSCCANCKKKLGTKTAIMLLVVIVPSKWLAVLEENYVLLVATSFAAGFAIAIIGPIVNAYIKEKFPKRFATVVGVYSFGIGTGATLSAALTVSFYNRFNQHWTVALGSWVVLAVIAFVFFGYSLFEASRII